MFGVDVVLLFLLLKVMSTWRRHVYLWGWKQRLLSVGNFLLECRYISLSACCKLVVTRKNLKEFMCDSITLNVLKMVLVR